MTSAVVAAPTPVGSTGPGRPRPREFDWPQITQTAPVLAATMLRYLDQIALSLRPASVVSADGDAAPFRWVSHQQPSRNRWLG